MNYIQKYFVTLVVLVVTFLSFSSWYSQSLEISRKNTYAILIDAGSSGSRLHIFYIEKFPHTKHQTIRSLGSKKTKIGLSTFSSNPSDAYTSIRPLFMFASETIPQKYHKSTSIFLFATAGMRLIVKEIQQQIYSSIYQSFLNDVFQFNLQINHLKTIGGEEEAFFGWISVNYLANRFSFDLQRLGDSIGSLDLGGYSTQIIFEPVIYKLSDTIDLNKVFMRSFLVYGASQMRDRYLRFIFMNNYLQSYCDHTNLKVHHSTYENKYIMGKNDFNLCRSILSSLLNPDVTCEKDCNVFGLKIPQIRGEFFAMSLFFYATNDLKQLHPNIDLINISLDKLQTYVISYCNLTYEEITSLYGENVDSYVERCFQLVYILTLLNDGYKFPSNSNSVKFTGKVNDIEVEWCLGAVITVLKDMKSKQTIIPYYSHILILIILIVIIIFLWHYVYKLHISNDSRKSSFRRLDEEMPLIS